MEEQRTSSWTSMLSWQNAKKFASSIIDPLKPVLTLSFVTQLANAQSHDLGYCFGPTDSNQTNYLWCLTHSLEHIYGQLLQTTCNMTNSSLCNTTFTDVAYFGKSALRITLCQVQFNDTLDPCVAAVLTNNITNGIFTGSDSFAITVMAFTVVAATTGVVMWLWTNPKQTPKPRDPNDETRRLLDKSEPSSEFEAPAAGR